MAGLAILTYSKDDDSARRSYGHGTGVVTRGLVVEPSSGQAGGQKLGGGTEMWPGWFPD